MPVTHVASGLTLSICPFTPSPPHPFTPWALTLERVQARGSRQAWYGNRCFAGGRVALRVDVAAGGTGSSRPRTGRHRPQAGDPERRRSGAPVPGVWVLRFV